MEARKVADPLRVSALSVRLSLSEHVSALLVSFLLTLGCCLACAAAGIVVRLAEWLLETTDADTSGASERLLQPLWDALVSPEHRIGAHLAPYTTSVAFPGILSLLFYWVACAPTALLDAVDSAWVRRRFKLQPERRSELHDWQRTLGLTLRHQLLFILPALGFQLAVRGPWLYGDRRCLLRCDGRELFPARAPTLVGAASKVLLCAVIFDAAYWYWHRCHHLSPLLYKHVHRVHHEYFAPFAWVTQYEHALELFAVSIFSIAVPIALDCHPLTEWLWLITAVQIAVDAHAGYELGIFHRLCPLWGGTVHHDNHHRNPKSNFQPFFTWFDLYFRTDFASVEAAKSGARANGRHELTKTE